MPDRIRVTVPGGLWQAGGPRRDFGLSTLPRDGAALLDCARPAGLPGEQANALLAQCLDGGAGTVAALTEGDRQALLLQLYAATFGDTVRGVLHCPCGADLELSVVVGDLLLSPYPAPRPSYDLAIDGYEITYRLPTAGDLAKAAAQERRTPGSGAAGLLADCLLGVRRHDLGVRRHDRPTSATALPATALPAAVVDAVAAAMAEQDPQADLEIDVSCPDCGAATPVTFDITVFLTSEIEARAAQLTADVHMLASQYHWSEADILRLSPHRRAAYLDLITRDAGAWPL